MQSTGKVALASNGKVPVSIPAPPTRETIFPKHDTWSLFSNRLMVRTSWKGNHSWGWVLPHRALPSSGTNHLSPELLGGFACSIWCLPGTFIFHIKSQGSVTSSGTPVPTLWQVSSHLPRTPCGFSSYSSSHRYHLSSAQLSTFTGIPGDLTPEPSLSPSLCSP